MIFRFVGIAAVALVTPPLVSGSTSAQPLTKAIVQAELVPGRPLVLLRITNLAVSALETWQVRIHYEVNGTPGSMNVTVDTNAATPVPGLQQGPVSPTGTRERRIALGHIPTRVSAEILMLGFEDGTFEGSRDEFKSVLANRERNAAVLTRWINELARVKGLSTSTAKAHLRAVMNTERQAAAGNDVHALEKLQTITEFVEGNSADSDFQKRVSLLQQSLEQQRDRALRHTRR